MHEAKKGAQSVVSDVDEWRWQKRWEENVCTCFITTQCARALTIASTAMNEIRKNERNNSKKLLLQRQKTEVRKQIPHDERILTGERGKKWKK